MKIKIFVISILLITCIFAQDIDNNLVNDMNNMNTEELDKNIIQSELIYSKPELALQSDVSFKESQILNSNRLGESLYQKATSLSDGQSLNDFIFDFNKFISSNRITNDQKKEVLLAFSNARNIDNNKDNTFNDDVLKEIINSYSNSKFDNINGNLNLIKENNELYIIFNNGHKISLNELSKYSNELSNSDKIELTQDGIIVGDTKISSGNLPYIKQNGNKSIMFQLNDINIKMNTNEQNILNSNDDKLDFDLGKSSILTIGNKEIKSNLDFNLYSNDGVNFKVKRVNAYLFEPEFQLNIYNNNYLFNTDYLLFNNDDNKINFNSAKIISNIGTIQTNGDCTLDLINGEAMRFYPEKESEFYYTSNNKRTLLIGSVIEPINVIKETQKKLLSELDEVGTSIVIDDRKIEDRDIGSKYISIHGSTKDYGVYGYYLDEIDVGEHFQKKYLDPVENRKIDTSSTYVLVKTPNDPSFLDRFMEYIRKKIGRSLGEDISDFLSKNFKK